MTIKSWRRSSLITDIKYENFSVGYPHAPTIGTASDGGTGTTASVAFTPVGSATSYTALSTPGSFTATGASSPLTVSGLTAGTAYTFQVKATNSTGDSAYSAASNSVTPAVPSSYFLISQLNPTSGTSAVFSSIPNTYKSLQIRYSVLASAYLRVQLNGDTGANYAWHILYGKNGSPTTGGVASTTYMALDGGNSTNSLYSTVGVIDIVDYASTSKYKTIKSLRGQDMNNTIASEVDMSSGLWQSTAAVTSFNLFLSTSSFSSGTTISLYGVN